MPDRANLKIIIPAVERLWNITCSLDDLPDTQVTAAGVAELHQALPQCQIVCDHGTLEPTAAAP